MAKNKEKDGKMTPLMRQYFKLKAKYEDAILLYRVGDFYETFGEDAKISANILGIVLTSRNNGGSDIALAGFPHHSLNTYLPKLVRAGYRVAICEQLEKPGKSKKVVKRGVTEMVTPGVTSDEELLDHQKNNFLAALYRASSSKLGIAFLDISTGEFFVCQESPGYISKLIQGFHPSEIIISRKDESFVHDFVDDEFYVYPMDDWVFTYDYGREKLLEHFEVQSLKGFGIEQLEAGQVAAGAAMHYLATTENHQLKHINSIQRLKTREHVWLDRFTIRNLELLQSQQPSGVPLIDVMDHTCSPMGSRLLKKWIVLPLTDIDQIEDRHVSVEFLLSDSAVREETGSLLDEVGDMERLISRASLGKMNPREMKQLEYSLALLPKLADLLGSIDCIPLRDLSEAIDPCTPLKEKLSESILDDPPAQVSKGQVVAEGVSDELDDLRHTISHSKDLLVEIQQREAKNTGISNLKVGFNKVFGYYLEVTNKYKDQGLIPEDWTRKQTLTNSERYITDELKELESKILGAEERIEELEEELYDEILEEVTEYIVPIQENARLLARLDCLLSFAYLAEKEGYVRPSMNTGDAIEIEQGRHPVIEHEMDPSETYVPNDLFIDTQNEQILMITGPNMSGKSALLRMTALISLMAQMGSFVPADAAKLGLVDRIFSRVGASDNISSGESTFMVEMNETASILNNLSDRSLILLDEIGRGTATYDGISIAWSIAEYLHEFASGQPKTLFATHYHELNELEKRFDRIKNYHISTKEAGRKVLFLRKLEPGGSEHSFGIHVAGMAGMPKEIINRANQILAKLEEKSMSLQGMNDRNDTRKKLREIPELMQLNMFEAGLDEETKEVLNTLEEMDLNTLTPIECMLKLKELKALLTKAAKEYKT